uniref:ABI family member 3 binding protein n=1 Tax=Mus spicilegus TaxID=10103 RepID=A0A8C6HMJ6_MUSSI
MLEISDALKAQLAKNETLALPAESKTPEVEKLAGQPVTVTPESVSRSTKPTLSSALDTAETALVLSEKTSETARSVLIPEFELPLSTLAPKRFPEFPEAKTAFPLEKPRGSWASSEEPWVVPGAKTPEDSRVVQPQTATYDVISSSTTSDETEIEIHTATRDPILDSVPPKTSRTAEQPRATLAPIEALFESRNVEIFTSPEVRPTTAAPQQTTSIPSTPKRQSTPKPPRVKPAPEPETRPSAQTTKVTTTDIEPVITRTKASVTTLAPKPPRPRTHRQRTKYKTTQSPKIPHSKPDLGPITPEPPLASTTKKVRRPRPKPQTTPHPEVPHTILVPATSLEPFIITEAPGTTLVPKLPQQPGYPHPKPKTTRSPAASPTELVPTPVFEPVTPLKEDPVTTIVPITDLERVTDLETPVAFRTEAPGTTLASKISQRTHRPRPRPRPKATLNPQAPETKTVPAVVLEPVTLRPEVQVTTLAPQKTQKKHRPSPKPKPVPSPEVTESKPVLPRVREPVTLRTETWVTTKAPKTPKRTRRPRPKPQTTPTPETPLTKPVAATDLEPSALSTEVPATVVLATALTPVTLRTKAPKTTTLAPNVQRTRRPHPRPKTTASTGVSESKSAPTELQSLVLKPVTSPSLEIIQSQSVSDDLELVAFSTESPQKTIVPRQTTSMPPKLKTPHSRMPAKEPVPKEPLHTTSKPKMPPSPEVADTTSAPLETRGIPLIPVISPRPSQEELQTAMEETDQSTQELFTTKIPRTTELAKTTQAPHRLHTAPVRPRIPGRPHGRPALNKTTTRPDKTKPRGPSHKNGVGTGTKQAPKPPSPGRNASVDSHATRKPGSVSGTRRPPIPHRHSSSRPMSPERRPLPPNNVTGKPGSAGIVSSSRVTSPPLKATLKPIGTATARPGAEQKEPTAPASEEEFGTTTDFSSSPTKETDPLGKPRFIGPHVRYIPKPENKPCSITDSVRRFPTEEATEGNATSPPQNPPTNLTVVTVEGCPSFVILDWEKPLNDTVTEYEVISRENGSFSGKNKSIQITNQTFSTVENLKPDTSYEFQVKPKNPLGEGPASNTVAFSTESADPRVSEPISAGRDAIWTERPFNSDSYSECKGKQYVKRTWYKKFVGVQLCNSLRYKIYLSDSLTGKFYNIGDQRGHGEDHCQFVDSFLDGRTGQQLTSEQLPTKEGYFRAVRQEPVQFGEIGGHTQINYVQWYECGTTIPGKW